MPFRAKRLIPTGGCASLRAGRVGLSAGGIAQRVAPGHRRRLAAEHWRVPRDAVQGAGPGHGRTGGTFAQVCDPEGANTEWLVRRNQFSCPVGEVSADLIVVFRCPPGIVAGFQMPFRAKRLIPTGGCASLRAGRVGLSAGGIASQVSRRHFEPGGLPPQGDVRASKPAGLVCRMVVSPSG
jgi:hypothetical protein